MARKRRPKDPSLGGTFVILLGSLVVLGVLLPALPAGAQHFWEHFRGTSTGIPGVLELDGEVGVRKPHKPGAEAPDGPCKGTFTADDGEVYKGVHAAVPGDCEAGAVYEDARLVPKNPSAWVNDDKDVAQVEGGGGWGAPFGALLIGTALIVVAGLSAFGCVLMIRDGLRTGSSRPARRR
ncbi:hypothetical protein O4J56_14630 [Nocardiopsis sp. RSe5-2]|uniref:DUF3592 domain-containing protein n=1 Tax=Nocardiopsis endophytica TaxID=3018445 RepID=A0ABT4U4I9_9ACTN|nr:hypothetical protein [Nocardiopsis endophytica]MDA2811876.1 hypothetical protein [Nocardiopsis endophytica]